MTSTSIQYRVVVAKGDERIDGSDDAAVIVTVARSVVAADGFDPTVAFMRGELKAVGHTGVLFDALSSGRCRDALVNLA